MVAARDGNMAACTRARFAIGLSELLRLVNALLKKKSTRVDKTNTDGFNALILAGACGSLLFLFRLIASCLRS